jgi:hypothetical protein
MQEYMVEVFSAEFEKLAEVGPFEYNKAQLHIETFKKRGLLATLTEKELFNLVHKK